MERNFSKEKHEPAIGDIKNILVNLTPTKDWLQVAEFAITHARSLGACVYFIDVIHDPFGSSGWNLPLPSLEEEYQAIVKEARDHLRATVEAESNKGVVMELIVREGEPVEMITEVIKEKRIDLLVVPGHSEGRIEWFLFESVNRRLMREMPCSVMLLKAPEGLE